MLADDMILSLKANHTTISAVLQTLQEFSKISNLMVNADKSIAFPLGPHHKVNKEKACDITPFTWSASEYCDYLGIQVPLQFNCKGKLATVHPQFNMHDYVHSSLLARDNYTDTILGRKHNGQAFIASKMSPLPSF